MTPQNNQGTSHIEGSFVDDDLIDVAAFIREIASSDLPHAKLVQEWLSGANVIPLPDPGPDTAKLEDMVLAELNARMVGGPIHADESFARVKLSSYTKKLLRQNPTGAQLASLNKCLLLDAFPKYLRRRRGRGKSLIQKLATVRKLANGKFAVFVDLISPREIEGKMRTGRQKFERQTLDQANSLCTEINNLLTGKKLARSLTAEEISKAEQFFWVLLEPNHPVWIDYLPEIVAHCEKTDFRIPDGTLPLISDAVRIFWKEHVKNLEHESLMNYRLVFGFLLPEFGHLRTNEMTDQMVLKLAHGDNRLTFWSTSYKHGQTEDEAFARLWDTPMVSDSERPWDHMTRTRFLSLARAFKNWLHSSENPVTQIPRNWCSASTIKIKKEKRSSQPEASIPEDDSVRGNDPECLKNPALTIPQAQALIDVAWVAYGGRYAPFYLHAMWCGTRVKETRKTHINALDLEDGVLSVPATVDKTDRGREVEVYPNVIVMAPALREAGLYTARGLRATPDARAVIQILAGFTSGSQKRIDRAEKERKRLEDLGISLPRHDWGIPFPRNALRRTALSMHYKLFFSPGLTTLWGGNTPGIFKKYYKRLVTKAEAREYWVMVPTWLKAKHPFHIELPKNHKLDPTLTKELQASADEARAAMKTFMEDLQNTKAKVEQQKYERSLDQARKRSAAHRQMKKAMAAESAGQAGETNPEPASVKPVIGDQTPPGAGDGASPKQPVGG